MRLMVYNGEWRGKGTPRPEDQVTLVNPRIVSTSESTDVVQEGCLSFHDKLRNMWIRGKVEVSAPACRLVGDLHTYWSLALMPAHPLWAMRRASCRRRVSDGMSKPLPAVNCSSDASLCLEYGLPWVKAICQRRLSA